LEYRDENRDPRALWMGQWEVFLRRELNFCVLRGAASGNFGPWIDMDGRYLVEGSDKATYLCVNALLMKFKLVQVKF
jgi:hypothetical protein